MHGFSRTPTKNSRSSKNDERIKTRNADSFFLAYMVPTVVDNFCVAIDAELRKRIPGYNKGKPYKAAHITIKPPVYNHPQLIPKIRNHLLEKIMLCELAPIEATITAIRSFDPTSESLGCIQLRVEGEGIKKQVRKLLRGFEMLRSPLCVNEGKELHILVAKNLSWEQMQPAQEIVWNMPGRPTPDQPLLLNQLLFTHRINGATKQEELFTMLPRES